MTLRRARFQNGSLQRVRRKSGSEVWEFRWREIATDGRKVRRNLLVGPVKQLPTAAAAQRAVAALRINFNCDTTFTRTLTVEVLVKHYEEKELPAGDHEEKSFATKQTYRGYLKKWILPRWGAYKITDVRSIAVEEWLKQVPRSRGTKAKIRNLMSALFNHAIRYEWLERNPITLVRQSAKRERVPEVLEVKELDHFSQHSVGGSEPWSCWQLVPDCAWEN